MTAINYRPKCYAIMCALLFSLGLPMNSAVCQEKKPPTSSKAASKTKPVLKESELDESGINVLGYFVSKSLTSDSGFGSTTTHPTAASARLLVIVVDVPAELLIPDKKRFAEIIKSHVSSAKTIQEKKQQQALVRETVTEFSTSQFALVLNGNDRRKCAYVTAWDSNNKIKKLGPLAASVTSYGKNEVTAAERKELALVWIVHQTLCEPPFAVQFQKYKPDDVPLNVISY